MLTDEMKRQVRDPQVGDEVTILPRVGLNRPKSSAVVLEVIYSSGHSNIYVLRDEHGTQKHHQRSAFEFPVQEDPKSALFFAEQSRNIYKTRTEQLEKQVEELQRRLEDAETRLDAADSCIHGVYTIKDGKVVIED